MGYNVLVKLNQTKKYFSKGDNIMKKKLFKKMVCVALTAISLTTAVTAVQPVQVQASIGKDEIKPLKALPKKHGKIDKVEYKAVNTCNLDGFFKEICSSYYVAYTNTASYPVRIQGKVTFYKNGKKIVECISNNKDKFIELYDEIDVYLYPKQRLTANYGFETFRKKNMADNYKISYTVKKVSNSEIKKKAKSSDLYAHSSGEIYHPELTNLEYKEHAIDLSNGKYYSKDKALYLDYFEVDKYGIYCDIAFNKDVHYTGWQCKTNFGVTLYLYDKDGYFLDYKRFQQGAGTFEKGDHVHFDEYIIDEYDDYSIDDIASFDIYLVSEEAEFKK